MSGGNIKNSSQYKVLTLTSFLMNFLHYFWATTYSPFRNDGGILRIFLRCNNNTIAHIFTSVVCVEGKIGKRFSLPFAVNLCSQYFSWLFGLALSVTSNQFFGILIFILEEFLIQFSENCDLLKQEVSYLLYILWKFSLSFTFDFHSHKLQVVHNLLVLGKVFQKEIHNYLRFLKEVLHNFCPQDGPFTMKMSTEF